jgi:competence protein ComGC
MKRSTIIRTAAGMGIAAVLLTTVTGVANAAPGGPNGGPVGSLIQNGTITRAQADAVKTALEALKVGKTDKPASLVSNGTITQAQADAIKAAGKGSVPTLVSNGTITQSQAAALKAACEAAYAAQEAARDAALNGLVSSGTLTSSQADAINTAIEAKHEAKQAARQNGTTPARPSARPSTAPSAS